MEHKSTKIKFTLSLISTFLATWFLIDFIDRNAPTLLVSDLWFSLDPLFNEDSFWVGFTHKHGPHRMGLAYVLFRITTHLSDWNPRWDMFLQAAIYSLSALLALRLKFLLFKKLDWFDWIIPLIFITTQSALTVIFNPYIHGLIPLFAVSASLCYFIKNTRIRYLSMAAIITIGIFSGFAVVVSMALLIIEGLKWLKSPRLQSLSIFGLPILSFGYVYFSQKSTPPVNLSNSFEYSLEYATLLTGNFLFTQPSRYWFIILLMGLITVSILIWLSKKSTPKSPDFYTITALLISSSLLFVILNIVGRAELGIGNAITTRYIPATMPLMFGIYLLIQHLKPSYSWFKIPLLLVFGFIMLKAQLETSTARIKRPIELANKTKQWEICLKENHSFKECNSKYTFKLVPEILEKHLQEKIDFLKANKLNIYKE